MKTTIIFDKTTGECAAFSYNDVWVIPASMDVRVYDDTFQPVLIEKDGTLFLDTNKVIIPKGTDSLY